VNHSFALCESNRTLQPTALVHALYLRLVRQRNTEGSDRNHFYTFAAKMKRLIVTDFAGDRGTRPPLFRRDPDLSIHAPPSPILALKKRMGLVP
jgi:hypothetical protein